MMIPERIQALFDFIDYLDSNKRDYNEKYVPLCSEITNTVDQRNVLKPDSNYKDKQQYDKLQAKLEELFAPITANVYEPISNKLRELKIWSGDQAYASIWNNSYPAISEFKRNFVPEDVDQVIQYKQKYLSFRKETHPDFFCLTLVFNSLDDILKQLFDFFKDTNENEFDAFEAKTIKLNSVDEVVAELRENNDKNVKFSIPFESLNKSSSQIIGLPDSKDMKSQEEIAELILDEFRKTNSKARHIVMMRTFRFSVIPKLNPKEQDLFDKAANGLIDEGYITYEDGKSGPECLRLTNKGYDRIYDDNYSSKSNSIIKKKKVPTSEFPDDVYQDVLKTLSNYGKDLEQKPKIFKSQDEEGLRDHFLSNLTGRYERTSATGETFNKEGKTDILLKDDKGNNLFIAECKWWRGAGVFQTTINQLFDNYITWRDTKAAIVFFVDNKDFTSVLVQIEEEAKKHPYYVQYLRTTDKSNFGFLFRQKDDANNNVQVEIMFFHFPT